MITFKAAFLRLIWWQSVCIYEMCEVAADTVDCIICTYNTYVQEQCWGYRLVCADGRQLACHVRSSCQHLQVLVIYTCVESKVCRIARSSMLPPPVFLHACNQGVCQICDNEFQSLSRLSAGSGLIMTLPCDSQHLIKCLAPCFAESRLHQIDRYCASCICQIIIVSKTC